nr:flagellar motor switch phosphatase FliY [uncultured Cellulosilyticum sp.]
MSEEKIKNDLSLREQDILGEVSNICMGTAATTLFTILNNRKVSITTPNVQVLGHEEIEEYFKNEAVATAIKSVEGVTGTNLLVLKEDDVKIITNLMMMGPGVAEEGPITELHLSAISEAMNQMMGSSSTSLSQMLNTLVDISAPNAMIIKDKKGWMKEIASDIEDAVIISFRMEIENTLDSNIAQIMSVKFARELIEGLDQSKL